jgi:hypothetical protein
VDRMGAQAGIHSVTKKLRRLFPKLFGGQYGLTSGRTKRYNCIAWALGQNDAWWEASLDGYWPKGIPDDGSVQAAIQLFESFGFACTHLGDVGFEIGVLKVAIYGDGGSYTHAARQLPSGRWTSKIGRLQDIEHDSLDALTSVANRIGTDADQAYGVLVQIMRNDRPTPIETLARQ